MSPKFKFQFSWKLRRNKLNLCARVGGMQKVAFKFFGSANCHDCMGKIGHTHGTLRFHKELNLVCYNMVQLLRGTMLVWDFEFSQNYKFVKKFRLSTCVHWKMVEIFSSKYMYMCDQCKAQFYSKPPFKALWSNSPLLEKSDDISEGRVNFT